MKIIEKICYILSGVAVCLFILAILPTQIMGSDLFQDIVILIFGGSMGIILKTVIEYRAKKDFEEKKTYQQAYSNIKGLISYLKDLYQNVGWGQVQFFYCSRHWQLAGRQKGTTDINEIHHWRDYGSKNKKELSQGLRELHMNLGLLKILRSHDKILEPLGTVHDNMTLFSLHNPEIKYPSSILSPSLNLCARTWSPPSKKLLYFKFFKSTDS